MGRYSHKSVSEKPGAIQFAESNVNIPEYSKPWTFTPVDRCDVAITIHFRNIDNRNLLDEIRIGFRYYDEPSFFRLDGAYLRQTGENQYSVTYVPETVLMKLFGSEPDDPTRVDPEPVPKIPCHELRSDYMYVEYNRLSYDWRGLETRPLDPLESPDVEEGLGFIGGYYEHSFQVPINTMELPECEDDFDPSQCECPPELFQETCEPTIYEFDYR